MVNGVGCWVDCGDKFLRFKMVDDGFVIFVHGISVCVGETIDGDYFAL